MKIGFNSFGVLYIIVYNLVDNLCSLKGPDLVCCGKFKA